MSAQLSPRTQAALEQIGEDESLYSDITEHTAGALQHWLAQQLRAAQELDDASFEQWFSQLREVAHTAVRTAPDDPTAVVATASRMLVNERRDRRRARMYAIGT